MFDQTGYASAFLATQNHQVAMPGTARTFVKQHLPNPVIAAIGRSPVWNGDHPSWESAEQSCTGYDAGAIVERVFEATSAVHRGDAAYEQDGVAYDEPDWDRPLAAALRWVAGASNGRLGVVDFGGALGGTWMQYQPTLTEVSSVRWTVVEQPTFVERGAEHFADDTLRFEDDLAAALADAREHAPRVTLLLGSVLPYLEAPREFLDQALELGFDHVIIDRTPLISGNRDRLTVQDVPERIYQASYPCWLLSRERLLAQLAPLYRRVSSWESADIATVPSTYEGFLFTRRQGPAAPTARIAGQ